MTRNSWLNLAIGFLALAVFQGFVISQTGYDIQFLGRFVAFGGFIAVAVWFGIGFFTSRTTSWEKIFGAADAATLILAAGLCILVGGYGNVGDFLTAVGKAALIIFPFISCIFCLVTWIFYGEWHLADFLEK